ncbi:hypothetical protein SNE40_017883 [Patella caerulea]|uniref:Uncharacterized protein n=1 Tax=Patella caerulea TaxID=87958 RepID=A0AAN8JBA1_PATCE
MQLSAISRKDIIVVFVLVVFFCMLVLLGQGNYSQLFSELYKEVQDSTNQLVKKPISIFSKLDNHEKCPSVLDKMVYGYWNIKPLSKEQSLEMRTFLNDSRTQHGLPGSLQRDDLNCGNVSFPRHLSPTITWFRALCDPYGKTPCCYNNKCSSSPIEQCKCSNCFDMRQPPHGEYSDFIPYDIRCKIRKYNYTEACQLLDGVTLYLSGDSYIRHIYTALLLFLRNNTFDGALKKGVSKVIHDQCTGMYMFTEKVCRLHLESDFRLKDLCGGKFKLMFNYFFSSVSGTHFVNRIKTIKAAPKSLVVFGVAIHDKYNTSTIKKKYIEPVVKTKGKNKWPKLLWTTPHSPGILNVGSRLTVFNFISQMDPILKKYKVPTFNTFNMTENMMSFDGNHYGLGINIWKIQILLNYIQELKDNGAW